MRCKKAIVVNAVSVKVVALTLLYSILAISPSVINPISTTTVYAGTITAPIERQGILNLSNNDGDSITPVMAASGNSNVYVAWVDDTLDNEAVFMARSIDGGTSFGNATVLSNKNGGNSSFPVEPQIVASGSNLYVMWYDNITGSYEPYLVISTDDGTRFSRPINLSHEAGVSNNYAADEYGLLAGFSQIAASGNNLYVIWYNNHTGNSQTFLTKSTDGGTSFSRPINLSQIAGIGSSKTLAVNGDNVYVLWSKIAEGNDTFGPAPSLDTKNQLLLTKSTDGGMTFSQSVIVADEDGFSGPPQLEASANNSVYVAWKQDTVEETETEGILKILSSRISLAKSTDGGSTFSQPVNIIESESSIDSDFNIASSGNHVYAVWSMDAAQRGLLSEQLVFAAKSTDSGTTFNEVPIEIGNGRFPDVAVSDDNNNWYVIWLYNIGNAEIFFTKVPVNQSSQLTNRNILGAKEGNVADAADLTSTLEKQNETFLTYENPNYEIRIEYPSNWERDDIPDTFGNLAVLVSFLSPLEPDSMDNFQENLNIVSSNPLPLGVNTLEAFANTNVREVTEGFEDAQLDRLTPTTLKGNNNSQAMLAEYTNRIQGLELKQMQVYTLEDDKGYVITYTAEASKYAAYLPTIQKMIDSFKIMPSSSSALAEGLGEEMKTIAPLQSLTTNNDTSNKTTITGDLPSEEQQQPATQDGSLAVSIETTDDPIRRGLQQTVITSVEDRNTKQKITGANVIGEVTFKSGSNIVERFSGISDSSGQVSHRWTIGDDTYDPGRYDIRIQVSAEGNRPTSTSTMFEVD